MDKKSFPLDKKIFLLDKKIFPMDKSEIPAHVAIIPDGNRRWAKAHKLSSLQGHKKGFDIAVILCRKLRELGVSTVTLWAFSTENWSRTPREVSYLMRLYGFLADKYLSEAMKDKIKITHLGRKDRLPKNLLNKIINMEEKTKNFTNYFINIALDYGGRDEIIRGIKKAGEKGVAQEISVENFNNFLDTSGQPYPDPDLIIRTSGEFRTSGFMPWQGAYSEYLYLDKYFPALLPRDMEDALQEYASRKRRFGK